MPTTIEADGSCEHVCADDWPSGAGHWERWTYWDRRLADVRLVGVRRRSSSGPSGCTRASRAAAVWLAVSGRAVRGAGRRPRADQAGRRTGRGGPSISMPEGLARLEGRWAGTGVAGLEYLDLEHPYAADLDLFGGVALRAALHRPHASRRGGAGLLAARAGRRRRRSRERHEAVDELRPRLDLREDLELLGAEVRAGIDPEALAAWCAAPRVFTGWVMPVVAADPGSARDGRRDRLAVLRDRACSPC